MNITHPRCRNLLSIISRLPQKHRVNKLRKEKPGFMLLEHPEQKKAPWMKYIVQKSTKPGKLVMDTCAGTLSVDKACMLLSKHRKIIRRKVDPICMIEAILLLILLYPHQLLTKQSDIDEEEQVCSFAEMYVKVVEAMEVRKCLDVWEVPEGLLSRQKLLLHITYHLGMTFGEEKLLQKTQCFSKPVELKIGARLNMYDICTLLAGNCGAASTVAMRSTTPPKDAAQDVSNGCAMGAGEIVDNYYGPIVYFNLSGQK